MNVQEWFDVVLFSINDWSPTLGQSILTLMFIVLTALIYRFLIRRALRSHFFSRDSSKKDRLRIVRDARITLILLVMWAILVILKLDLYLFKGGKIDIMLSSIVVGLIILYIARFLDLIINKVVVYNMYINRDSIHEPLTLQAMKKDERKAASKLVQYIVYVFAILILINSLQLDFTLFAFQKEDYIFNFKISNIFKIALIVLVVRLLIWLVIQIVLYGYYRQKKINIGSQFAINQLFKYILYFMAIMLALESSGIRMTLVWGGAAALLVGVGLGLQKTFNDFVSGIILLFERSVEVGDEVAFGETIGSVKKIGLRSSIVETRDSTTLIVPNSDLVANKVVNWSHTYKMARFNVTVGVSFGSDTILVKDLLLEAAKVNPHILDYPSPFVRFSNFGDSALIFNIYFFSREFVIIEDVKSEIRFKIDELFRENGVTIPFPQRDVWMR